MNREKILATISLMSIAINAHAQSVGGGNVFQATGTGSANTVFATPNGSPGVGSFRLLLGADLPLPSGSTIGGVMSISPVSHEWIDSINVSGVPHLSTPSFSDLSGSLSTAQCPAGTTGAIGCLQVGGGLNVTAGVARLGTVAGVTHQWINSINSSGAAQLSQPACADVSDASVYCNATLGQLPGIGTNTAATSGNVAELVAAIVNGESFSVSISAASPAVVTMAGNTFASRCTALGINKCVLPVNFTGLTGTAGIANATVYYVDPASISGSTFKVATTVANAIAATDVNSSATDAGTGVASSLLGSSGVSQGTAAIYLAPGDWDCNGNNVFNNVTSVVPTLATSAINNSTGLPSLYDGAAVQIQGTFGTASISALAVGTKQVLLNAQTLTYLDASETWTGGATKPTTTGMLRCRRTH